MTSRRGRSTSPQKNPRLSRASDEDDSILNTRPFEAFGRTVQATASQLITHNFTGDVASSQHQAADAYRSAMGTVHRSMHKPAIQRSVFSLAKANPRELIRSNFNTSEIEHRAITYVPDELLRNMPLNSSPFSLFEGFKASLPEEDESNEHGGRRKRHGKHGSKGQKLLEGAASKEEEESGSPQLAKLKGTKNRLDHRLEMMGIRKTMCASEIREIDNKISNLNTMRKVVLDRLGGLEQEEHDMEQELMEVSEKLEDLQEELEDQAALASKSPVQAPVEPESIEEEEQDDEGMKESFMSESIYEKLPKASSKESPKSKRRRTPRRISMPVLHEHMEPGSRIREMQAHNDMITALDFDAPFGTMVTAALDDTVRVWDLNAGRCMGLLEGHLSSVRCLQVEDNIVATGSMDASIRLWDLSHAEYTPQAAQSSSSKPSVTDNSDDESAAATGEQLFTPAASEADEADDMEYRGNAMQDCHLFTLSAHVAEITALDFQGNTLVSGSADKTLRQWDLEKGRCVQTLDVLWAAAQASTINPSINAAPSNALGAGPASANSNGGGWWRPTSGRLPAAEADFVGALQVFDAALACGTADGMVRLWDLRSGMVHRSLVGHTGPITALQFDDTFLVTGSRDRSIRIWDLRTGTIHDAFAYDNPITSMQFDARRIVSAGGEDVVKVYDKTDGRHWDCGAGADASAEEATSGVEGVNRLTPAVVERVRIKDGYLVEGRKDGVVGVWSC